MAEAPTLTGERNELRVPAAAAFEESAAFFEPAAVEDDCAEDPCEHGGLCTDGVNDFSCECPAGYDGKTCDHDIDDCAGNPCQNGGTCTDAVNGFSCTCPDAYYGATCEDAYLCVGVDEHQNATLTCPAGQVISSIKFASYGMPTGTCGAYQTATCHAPKSKGVFASNCVGQNTCSVAAENNVFDDPCVGTLKHLNVQAVCAAP